jgi:RND family efflux transporter MFP subunit
VVSFCAVPLLLWACSGGTPAALPPPEVTVAQPVRREVQLYEEFSGQTRATEYAEIRARVSGSLDEMSFRPSTIVKAGDVLFEIERRTYQAAYDEAVGEIGRAESMLAKTASDLRRVEEAIRERAVSQSDLDTAVAARDNARASLVAAKARRDKAEIELGYTQVKTPISGRVGRNLVDIGNLVGSTEPTLLTTVTRIQPIYVYFNAPEQLVLKILAVKDVKAAAEAGAPRVRVATALDDDFPHEGQVDFIDNTVDPATGTIEMRAVLANEGNVLFPGLFVRVQVLAGPPAASLLVDERAIGTDLGGKYVLLVGDGDVVEQRYVKLGPVQEDGMVVVIEGLKGDERYVANGMLRARPGFPVRAQTAAEAAGAATPAPGEG